MTFGTFVKSFRKEYGLTQEELVEKLYLFDDLFFGGLDATTLSKWERNVTRPKTAKQSHFVKFTQAYSGKPLPVFSEMPFETLQQEICHTGLENIVKGRQKELVLRLPTTLMRIDTLHIVPLEASTRKKTLMELAVDFRNNIHPVPEHITVENVSSWMQHPANPFWLAYYKEVTTGMFFALRLKPDAYRALLLFERALNDIGTQDFASEEEEGCYFPFITFALNDTSATFLLLRFYTEVIARQHTTKRIGTSVLREEARRFVKRMGLFPLETYRKEGVEITAYDTSIEAFLTAEPAVKSMFVATVCEEE